MIRESNQIHYYSQQKQNSVIKQKNENNQLYIHQNDNENSDDSESDEDESETEIKPIKTQFIDDSKNSDPLKPNTNFSSNDNFLFLEGQKVEVKGECTNVPTLHYEWLNNSWYGGTIKQKRRDCIGLCTNVYLIHFDEFHEEDDTWTYEHFIRAPTNKKFLSKSDKVQEGERIEVVARIDNGLGTEPCSWAEAFVVKDEGDVLTVSYVNNFWNENPEWKEWKQVLKEEIRRGEEENSIRLRNERHERDVSLFNRRLALHHRKRGSQMGRPRLGGQPLDLYELYRLVTRYGGIEKITQSAGVLTKLYQYLPNYSPTMTSGAWALKKKYMMLLYSYEQVFYWGKNDEGNEMEKWDTLRKPNPKKRKKPSTSEKYSLKKSPLPQTKRHNIASSSQQPEFVNVLRPEVQSNSPIPSLPHTPFQIAQSAPTRVKLFGQDLLIPD